ncbi:MAG: histone deacetylase [Planctomycetota bacterium]
MFIYSKNYTLDWDRHIFPVEKYKLVFDRIQAEGIAKPGDIIAPEPAKEEDVLLVHAPEYWKKIVRLTEMPSRTILEFEAPFTKQTLSAVMYHTGGTITAVKTAVELGIAVINIGGGFHHAYSNRGGGFCFINDVAIAVKKALISEWIKNCIIVDLDLHQGNGTAKIFENEQNVFTFSMHQERLYPKKETSSLDIGLADGTDDNKYLSILTENLTSLLDSQKYDLLLYIAGADPFEKDQLGSLKLTSQGLAKRDAIVFSQAKSKSIPIAVVLGGGYAEKVEDVANIHFSTCREVRKCNFK